MSAISIKDVNNAPKGLIGQWKMPNFTLQGSKPSPQKNLNHHAFFVPRLISPSDCAKLIAMLPKQKHHVPVGLQGYPEHGAIGSFRANTWSPNLAESLWTNFSRYFKDTYTMLDTTPTDWFATQDRKEHRVWKAVGVSPLMRFMRYPQGGQHWPHYDMGYDYGDGRRTLFSVVVFLNDIEETCGGHTRLIQDNQAHTHAAHRDYSDWTRAAYPSEIIDAVVPSCGGVFFFHHRLCHDVSPYTGSQFRYILRTDIVFKAIENIR